MKRLWNPFKLTIVLLCFGLLCVPAARAGTYALGCASALVPEMMGGTPVAPVPMCNEPGTFVAAMSTPFTSTTGTITGDLLSAVFDDSGTLDFLYQVVSNASSTDNIAHLSVSVFSGAYSSSCGATCVGVAFTGTVPAGISTPPWKAGPGTCPMGPSGTCAPIDVTTATGSTIDWDFNIPASYIGKGQWSPILIVSTTATQYTTGNISEIDGGTSTKPAFVPLATVPEPATMAVLGLGLIGLGTLWRRRTNR
jgi:hypothetical protein